ncbi:MAG TPA: hypothetical protein VGC41_28465, partial [Kofleriaceae bacterium]
ILVELCHFARDRDGLPPMLDRAIAMWMATRVWPAVAYPEPGCDDAIAGAPWLAQIGQAFARRYGVHAIVRAQAGVTPWDVPIAELDHLLRATWSEWSARESLDLTADVVAAERPIGGPDDAAFDRQIVGDGLRAMCLFHELIGGSFRTRTRVDERPIFVDAIAGTIATAPHTEHDLVAPRYWLPEKVAATIRARGHVGYELLLGSIAAIPAAVATICDGVSPDNFVLVVR